jgi:methionyl-tRNA synthetase
MSKSKGSSAKSKISKKDIGKEIYKKLQKALSAYEGGMKKSAFEKGLRKASKLVSAAILKHTHDKSLKKAKSKRKAKPVKKVKATK